ncbi:dehydrogenase [Marmoricola endophyticus]|uniref:Dehydrogenase n=1 Tax=Marmoricola endophyticus TaxID=2040280 RepID=A0A917F9W0_9ACTN|nr:2-hydroxyacid dehydrogenase [Marmoricola endophyticus]GGF58484.1 dehydrogenase [Marmoricola endophyticus]
MSEDRLVWVPFGAERLGETTFDGLRVETQKPGIDWRVDEGGAPQSAADVRFWVMPYGFSNQVHDQQMIEAMPNLEVVQTLSAGVEHVRPHVPAHVTLCNARGVHDASTAELAVGLAIASLRGIPDYVREAEHRVWRQRMQPALADRRVMILGYGSIGEAIERRLVPFETEVVRVARTAREGVHGFEEIPALLPEVDVVILVVPATEQTVGMVDAAFLASMKDGALLVNVARGSIVDSDALLAELRRERITAALDVVDTEPMPEDHPLWGAPGLLLSPHVGGTTDAMWPRAYRMVAAQLTRYAAGEELANVMNGPY